MIYRNWEKSHFHFFIRSSMYGVNGLSFGRSINRRIKSRAHNRMDTASPNVQINGSKACIGES